MFRFITLILINEACGAVCCTDGGKHLHGLFLPVQQPLSGIPCLCLDLKITGQLLIFTLRQNGLVPDITCKKPQPQNQKDDCFIT
ncbi:hypothetical protein T072_13040 [Salmonella enterica subsp. enterica]|nr:hypothetical protein [Salmonella enterica subsp. enterica]